MYSLQDPDKQHISISLQPSYSPIDTALQNIGNNSLLSDAITNLKEKMASLPPEDRYSIGIEACQLVDNLKKSVTEPYAIIKTFEKNCYSHSAGSHPILKAVAKAIAVVAITAFVTVVAALTGFGIGFAVGAWAGPAAFISGVTGASAGLAVGALAAYGLFKESRVEKAIHRLAETACNEARANEI